MAPLVGSWAVKGGAMLGHRGFPRGPGLIAARQAQAEGKPPRAPDVEAGHRVRRQGLGAVALVVMPGHVVAQTPHVCAQWRIDADTRVASSTAMRVGVLEHEADAAALERLRPPRRFREDAGEVRGVGTVAETAGDMGQTLMGQDHQPRPRVLERPTRPRVLNQVAADCGVVGHHRRRGHDRPFHDPPPRPGQCIQPGPSVAWGPWHGKSQQSSIINYFDI
jgi:hypothetical protein